MSAIDKTVNTVIVSESFEHVGRIYGKERDKNASLALVFVCEDAVLSSPLSNPVQPNAFQDSMF